MDELRQPVAIQIHRSDVCQRAGRSGGKTTRRSNDDPRDDHPRNCTRALQATSAGARMVGGVVLNQQVITEVALGVPQDAVCVIGVVLGAVVLDE